VEMIPPDGAKAVAAQRVPTLPEWCTTSGAADGSAAPLWCVSRGPSQRFVAEAPAPPAGARAAPWEVAGVAPDAASASSSTAKPFAEDASATKHGPTEEDSSNNASPQTLAAARPMKKSATKKKKAKSAAAEGDNIDDLVGDLLDVDTLAGTDSSRKHAGVAHELIPRFRCTQCDFEILRVQDHVWSEEVDYMFCRNFYPNVKKLQKHLRPRRDGTAYCCQCSWKSSQGVVELAQVAEGLRWKVVDPAL